LATISFFDNWLQEHIEQYDRPSFAHNTVNLNAVSLNTSNLTLMTESDRVDDFGLQSTERRNSERRKYKRIRQKDVVEDQILVHCHNVTQERNGQATIVDMSPGGLMLMASSDGHKVGDLLIVTCSIGSHFKMKEKVKVRRAIKKIYGVEFVSLSLEAKNFITGLYEAIYMSRKHLLP
jgi:hypothetical protein